jgi:hypothetical protein
VWTKRIVHWSFLLPILWCDSCWQLSTRRRISHIWLYRSEKKVIFLQNYALYWWPVLCLFGGEFFHNLTRKSRKVPKVQRSFFGGKNEPKSWYYDKDNLKSPYLENRFNKSANYMRNLKIFYFPLYPLINLANSSCTWLPTHLLHKFGEKEKEHCWWHVL